MAEMESILEYLDKNKGAEAKYVALDMLEELDSYPNFRIMIESPRYYLKWTRKSLFPGRKNRIRNDLQRTIN